MLKDEKGQSGGRKCETRITKKESEKHIQRTDRHSPRIMYMRFRGINEALNELLSRDRGRHCKR